MRYAKINNSLQKKGGIHNFHDSETEITERARAEKYVQLNWLCFIKQILGL